MSVGPLIEKKRGPFSLRVRVRALKNIPPMLALAWRASPLWVSVLILTSLVAGLTPAAQAVIGQYLLDDVVQAVLRWPHQHLPYTALFITWQYVRLPVLLNLGLVVLSTASSQLDALATRLSQNRLEIHIQGIVAEHLNKLSVPQFEDESMYKTIHAIEQEAAHKPSEALKQMRALFRSLITILSLATVLWSLAWWLVIIVIVVRFPAFYLSAVHASAEYDLSEEQEKPRRHASYLVRVGSTDADKRDITAYHLGSFLLERYRVIAQKLFKKKQQMYIVHTVIEWLLSNIATVVNSAIWLYIATQAVVGSISFGGITKYAAVSNQLGTSFQELLGGLSEIYSSCLFVQELLEALAMKPIVVSGPVKIVGPVKEVEYRDVSFTYPGKTEKALTGVSFIIREGQKVAFVGPNGSGKSTVVALLLRFYDPDEGEILVNGTNVKAFDLSAYHSTFGVLLQRFMQMHLTVAENIGVGDLSMLGNEKAIKQAAKEAGAIGFIESLPDGFKTMMGRWFGGVELSGGQWQKIGLARAFMRNAPILVLDEPSSALDPQAEMDLFNRIYQLTSNKIAVFISHRFGTVKRADRIFVMSEGRIVEADSHVELMKLEDGLYRKLYNLQASTYDR